MPKSFEQLVEEAIDVRLIEIDKLRVHLSSLSDRDIVGYLASLIIARLYAFLEGGVKDIVVAYVDSYRGSIGSVADLKPHYVFWRYEEPIRGCLANLPLQQLLGADALVLARLSQETIPRSINVRYEYSTMNAEALKEIYIGCGLDAGLVDSHSAAINQLCGRRQDVAHGRFLFSDSSDHIVRMADTFRNLVTQLLYDLGLQCIENHARRALVA